MLAPTWRIEHGALVVTSRMLRLTPHATAVLLVLGLSLAIALAAGVSHQLAFVRRDAQRELEQHAWRLRQLLGGVPVPRKSTNPVTAP